jgi:hypothetical protein
MCNFKKKKKKIKKKQQSSLTDDSLKPSPKLDLLSIEHNSKDAAPEEDIEIWKNP